MSRPYRFQPRAPQPNRFRLCLPSQARLAKARAAGVDTSSIEAFNAWDRERKR